MAKTLDEAEILKNTEIVHKLVNRVKEWNTEKGTQLEKMLDSSVGSTFFTAPASARIEHHSCFNGGLCYHTLKVISNLLKFAKTLCPDKWPDGQLVFVSLVHDIGKCGDGVNEYYEANDSKWHVEKGMLYKFNDKCTFMTTAHRSIFLLQKFGIPLTAEEFVTVLIHDGPYVKENEPYNHENLDLSLLLHWADAWATVEEKKEV